MATEVVVIRDTREKENHGYAFEPDIKDKLWTKTVEIVLETGDYCLGSVDGSTLTVWDKLLVVERKESVTEVAGNLLEARFFNEMERLSHIKHAYVLCEFSLDQLMGYPHGCGIPSRRVKYIRMKGSFLLKKILEIQAKYTNIKFVFAGRYGREATEQILKEVLRAETGLKTGRTLQFNTVGIEMVNSHYVEKIEKQKVKSVRKTKPKT